MNKSIGRKNRRKEIKKNKDGDGRLRARINNYESSHSFLKKYKEEKEKNENE